MLPDLILAIVGVIYAVLLAFIAVSTWESFNKSQDAAELEANMVDNLYVDSAGLPPKLAFFRLPAFAGICAIGH